VLQIFLVEKKDGGLEASDKSPPVCKGRTLQNGGLHLLPDLLQLRNRIVKMDQKDA